MLSNHFDFIIVLSDIYLPDISSGLLHHLSSLGLWGINVTVGSHKPTQIAH